MLHPMSETRPIAVFRFSRTEGPGHFATFLEGNRLPWTLVKLDEGEAVPASSEPFAGLGFMGGPMGANDELPWTQPVLSLMRDAVHRRVPVIGHCLGGQLLSRALGGCVSRNPVKEIGWVRIDAEGTPAAREWLGDGAGTLESFQWHEDTFTLPPGSERILRGSTCENQAYVVDGLHLGMQCHVEMDTSLIDTWCRTGAGEIRESLGTSPAVQDTSTILALAQRNLAGLSATADRLYSRWIQGLRS
jgi:GMP synthase-like glutamine amidotransferase